MAMYEFYQKDELTGADKTTRVLVDPSFPWHLLIFLRELAPYKFRRVT